MEWVAFALLAALLWAVESVTDKILISKFIKNPSVMTIIWAFLQLIVLVILVFHSLDLSNFFVIFLAIVSGIISMLNAIPYFKALSLEEASRVIPLIHFSPLIVLVLSFVFLGERLNFNQIIAFFLILIGGFLLSLRNIKGMFTLKRAFWLMVFVAFVFAISQILSKYVYEHVTFLDGFFWFKVGAFFGGSVLLLIKRNRDNFVKSMNVIKSKNFMIIILGAGIISFVGSLSFNYAIKLGPVSLVSVLDGIAPVFILVIIILLSKYFPKILKEELDKKVLLTKAFAISLMIMGLYFLYI